MDTIDVDIIKIKECGIELQELSEDLNFQLNELFEKLENIEKYGWVGEGANKYSMRVRLDKNMYLEFKDILKNEGIFLENFADNLDKKIDLVKEERNY